MNVKIITFANQSKEEDPLELVYKYLPKKGFNYRKFYSDHQELMEKKKFTEFEISILKNVQACKFDHSCKYDECAICIDKFADNEEIISLPGCGHNFHWSCVEAWFQKSNFCPICKQHQRSALHIAYLEDKVSKKTSKSSRQEVNINDPKKTEKISHLLESLI